MNFDIDSHHQDLQQTIRAFGKTFSSDTATREAAGTFSREDWKRLSDAQLTGLLTETVQHQLQLDFLSTAWLFEAFGEGCSDGGLSFSLGAHLCAGVYPVVRYATETQLQNYNAAILTGDCIIACAMTEATAGSDAFTMKTTATRTDKGFVIRGEKHFCTNAPIADVFLVYALTNPEKGFFGGISAFLVPKNTPGLSVGKIEKKAGLHSSPLATVYFDDVVVGPEALLGKEGGGVHVFRTAMTCERVLLAAMHVGAMKRLCALVVDYSKTRTSGKKTLSEHQAVAFRIAEMHLQTEAAALLVCKAASTFDPKNPSTLSTSQVKVFVSEAYEGVARKAQLVFGGAGYLEDSGIPAAIRDAQAAAIYSGTNDVQRLLIASEIR